MNAKLNISSRPFWDINMEELDPENHKEFIIRRVFERGKWQDIKEIVRFYSYSEVRETLKNTESMSEKGLNLASVIFNLSKKDFKCSTKKQFRRVYYKP